MKTNKYELSITIDHPIFQDSLIDLEANVEVETEDRSVGINGGLILHGFEVLEIDNKKYSKRILKSIESHIKNNMKKYEDCILDEIFEGRAE